ncbi:MAG: exodeoxyribonuclease VII large subunit [Lentisphaerae bacterium]|jgi:exodeoxyribonuclease VII large subunit|nr:exodeoxyribonuclease VII large subunit [Lentisphaerota bacterium]
MGEPAGNFILSVSDLTARVKWLLEQNFRTLAVQGEISDLVIHRSGHVYFTLKDRGSQLRAVFFRGAATAERLQLARGMAVIATGRLTVYEPQGIYQLSVLDVKPLGLGDLHQRFEELKQRLQAEGLFDLERKRPVPTLPRCVGLITSLDGAAIEDFFNVLNRRFAGMHVRIIPTAVQGDSAAAQIANAIRFFNARRACDVIVVTRGGGSIEDLWAFNEEVLARAVAGSEIPVISAVGHERDHSICDFVADFRAPTPSAAAEQVVMAKENFFERIANLRRRLRDALLLRVAALRQRYVRAASCSLLQRPDDMVMLRQQRLDFLAARLEQTLPRLHERALNRLTSAGERLPPALNALVRQRRDRFTRAEQTLNALAPRRVLARGYSILLNQEGQALRDAAETRPGEAIRAMLAKGDLELTVKCVIPTEPSP